MSCRASLFAPSSTLVLLLTTTLSLGCAIESPEGGTSRAGQTAEPGRTAEPGEPADRESSFTLRVFFLGLIGFVPSADGDAMTALVVDARSGFEASDGTELPAHRAVLAARAANCAGDCQTEAEEVAAYIYQSMRDPDDRRAELEEAIDGGGVWNLGRDEISIEGDFEESRLRVRRGRRQERSSVPSNAIERSDFSWLARIRDFAPQAAQVDPAFLSGNPPARLAARLTLNAGSLSSYKLVARSGKVHPLYFKPLSGDGPTGAFRQALTDWIVAETKVRGCQVRFRSEPFHGGGGRAMTLAPAECDGGVVEVAVVNLGEDSFQWHESFEERHRSAQAGRHFELFYELSLEKPPLDRRPVPHLVESEGTPTVTLNELRPRASERSKLLESLSIPYRSTYARPICPVALFEAAGA